MAVARADALGLDGVETLRNDRRAAWIRSQGSVDDRLPASELSERVRSDPELAHSASRAAP